MLPKKLEKELNDQVTYEYDSSWIYLQMEQYFAAQNLDGFAHFFARQAEEEDKHAHKFAGYLVERNSSVTLAALRQPKADYTSVVEVFEEALKHEQFITARIHTLMNVAIETKDEATQVFLQWFLTEQVEEEDTMQTILDRFQIFGSDGASLYLMEQELGKRE
ncbi:hypothetical protein AUK40_04290 [Candidatus Wirthbacteria bacterium CG2_30_54_11]|uniref:Ferritin n=1 Tax=Candidatus Wirthbacteria bacterium CG2_30_54_11 TaxID=1817892 RepID=A0A1J5IXE0_9BACT|nr:MAG: hypothetical protein AUK40_04290 [Candidatus Wirthbacteria bacterium CG2_30_54_11]